MGRGLACKHVEPDGSSQTDDIKAWGGGGGDKYPIRDGEATPYLLLKLLILLTLLRLLTMLQSLRALDISSPSESRSAYKCQV